MKTIIVLLATVMGVSVKAQTNFDYLTCAGVTYSNVTILRATAAYLVLSHYDGITKVPLTNLPYSLQKRYPYDPTNAVKVFAAEEQHKKEVVTQRIAQEKFLNSLKGTNQIVRISAVWDSYGLCDTSKGRIYVMNLPASTTGYFAQVSQLKADESDSADRAAALQRQVEQDDAKVSAAIWVNSDDGAGFIMNLKQERLRARDAAENTERLKEQLMDLQTKEHSFTTVVAFPTGLSYSGLPKWQCVAAVQ